MYPLTRNGYENNSLRVIACNFEAIACPLDLRERSLQGLFLGITHQIRNFGENIYVCLQVGLKQTIAEHKKKLFRARFSVGLGFFVSRLSVYFTDKKTKWKVLASGSNIFVSEGLQILLSECWKGLFNFHTGNHENHGNQILKTIPFIRGLAKGVGRKRFPRFVLICSEFQNLKQSGTNRKKTEQIGTDRCIPGNKERKSEQIRRKRGNRTNSEQIGTNPLLPTPNRGLRFI